MQTGAAMDRRLWAWLRFMQSSLTLSSSDRTEPKLILIQLQHDNIDQHMGLASNYTNVGKAVLTYCSSVTADPTGETPKCFLQC